MSGEMDFPESLSAADDAEPGSGETAGSSRPGPCSDVLGGRELGASLDLLRCAQQGDPAALDDLFRRYQERVHRIARIRMGPRVRSFMESNDLVQNTFLVAQRKLAEFEPRSHAAIIHWLATILQHQIHDANDYATAARRNREVEVSIEPREGLSGDGSPAIEPASPDPGAATRASERELHELYDACVQELEDDQREVILLRDYANGSWEFIREQLGRPTTEAVMQLYSRARARLARRLGARLGER